MPNAFTISLYFPSDSITLPPSPNKLQIPELHGPVLSAEFQDVPDNSDLPHRTMTAATSAATTGTKSHPVWRAPHPRRVGRVATAPLSSQLSRRPGPGNWNNGAPSGWHGAALDDDQESGWAGGNSGRGCGMVLMVLSRNSKRRF